MEPEKKMKAIWQNDHSSMTKKGLKVSFEVSRAYTLAKDQYTATELDNYMALAQAIRDRIVERWISTQQRYHKNNLKRVYYISMEFLIGRLLGNFIYNFGLEKVADEALSELNLDMNSIRNQENDAGLGNGGLGRLAACFLDSMATLGIPAHGYGIRYDYGIFNQRIHNGYQLEGPDEWLSTGNPWQFARPEYGVRIRFGGRTEMYHDDQGRLRTQWIDTHDVLAIPYDIPVTGYKNDVVNTLRLWSARSPEEFDFDYFNHGDYHQAVYQRINSENISKVLYPNDNVSQGEELRLKQEYFMTAASVADIIRRFFSENDDIHQLPEKAVIQLNDTHPALAVVELMRLLLDEYLLPWNEAWDITTRTFAYTNHTLLPEALETWTVNLMGRLLPRHLQIIYEINMRFLKEVQRHFPGDTERVARMSLVSEYPVKQVRMAYLAIVASFSVNGVSDLHSTLLTKSLFKDFYELSPNKFNNKTNGITQRRWLLKANPRLSKLITDSIGDQWVTNLEHLQNLESLKDDKGFVKKWQRIKQDNKTDLAEYIVKSNGIIVNPDSIFDVQVKRIHEYKRQMMFAFYIISQYLTLKNNPDAFIYPRTFIIGGKAAPAYFMAKRTIKFINSIAEVINNDPTIGDRLKVVFLENYRVSLAEKIFPASELSEQISTAGKEASGTGNMKFMLNGALTIGTMDGANVEINNFVGDDNMFIFGLREEEVHQLRVSGYNPMDFVQRSPMLQEIKRLIDCDFFSLNETGIFQPISDSVFGPDPFLVCADFDAYSARQDDVSRLYQDQTKWNEKSIINVSRSGFFSSDRTIREYAEDIWNVPTA
jgi:starch phosphorylase